MTRTRIAWALSITVSVALTAWAVSKQGLKASIPAIVIGLSGGWVLGRISR